MKNVLFVCIHNSARSQMAEAFLKQTCGDEFVAHSAGLEPGKLNPIVVEAMHEIGIDISGNKTKAVFDMYKSGKPFAYVITVCDEASAERCPIFPGITQRLHWGFPIPQVSRGRTKKDWRRLAKCATRSRRRSSNGVRKSAPQPPRGVSPEHCILCVAVTTEIMRWHFSF